MPAKATTSRRIVDLDAARKARAEVKTEDAPMVKLHGREYILPSALPAIVLVGIGRLQLGEFSGFTDMIEALFHEDAGDILKLGLDLTDIEDIVAVYGLGESSASED